MSSALLRNTITFLILWIGVASCSPTSSLPVIDLGYVKQRATVYNETHNWYIFKNVRFAAPPLGNLRFRKPQLPLKETEIQDGNINDTICAQTIPPLFTGTSEPITYGTEDCLFLDIYVPKSVKPTDCVPVLAWFYGGGYTIGSKEMWGDPAGLIDSSDEPIIYVASNYRLGPFGWLADAEQDIDLNVGLHDTRAAMDWISEYIPKFGGDKERVTVIGESAGGGVIMHAITAYGGEKLPPPFKQAILQSPGFFPEKDNFKLRAAIYNEFESTANCTSLECLRQAPTEVLIAASRDLILRQGQGGLGLFTPVVDGDYVPDIPAKLLSQGRFHHSIKSIIAANNGFEGYIFTPSPDNITTNSFDDYISGLFPNASASLIQRVNELYPKGSNLTEEWVRFVDMIGDATLTCNSVALAQAFQKKAYRYIFNIPPAWHGQDIYYTFYNAPNDTAPTNWTASVHQEYITDFTVYGKPGCAGTSPCFPNYEPGSEALELDSTEVKVISDPWDNERCRFWRNEAWA